MVTPTHRCLLQLMLFARGTDGPIHVQHFPDPNPLTRSWLKSCEEWGLPYNEDYNSGEQYGCSNVQVNIKEGVRQKCVAASYKLCAVGIRFPPGAYVAAVLL